MHVALRESPFDPWQELASYVAGRPALAGQYGATAVFVGTLRDFNQGEQVREMTLEHYPGMTERYLREIAARAQAGRDILDSVTLHRIGAVKAHETIVLVAVWSAHRQAAFDACREMMEELKTGAPFWKRELTGRGSRWVSPET